MARLSRQLVEGVGGAGAETWAVEAGDVATLSDWLARLIDAAGDAGLGPFDVRLHGPDEARRYAVELARGDGAAEASGRPGRMRSRRVVDVRMRSLERERATALVDAWTPGLDVELCSSGSPVELRLRRRDATTAQVRLGPGSGGPWDLFASLPVTSGVGSARVERGDRRGRARLARRRVLTITAISAAVIGSALVASSAGRRSATSSTAPSTQSASSGPALQTIPPPSGSAIAADPTTGGFLLVGCCDPPRPGMPRPVSTWEWDGSSWTHDQPSTMPPYARNMVLGFDGVTHAFVLHTGDTSAATWKWNPSARAWQLEPDAVQPPVGPASVVGEPSTDAEPISGLLVVTGAQFGSELQAWSRSGGGWRLAGAVAVPAGGLSGNIRFPIADDEERGNSVLVLESGAESTAATYVYDGHSWAEVATTGLPYDPNTQLTWDSALRRVLAILPGDSGVVGRGAVGTAETWAWDGTAWTELATSGGPGGRGRLLTSSLGVVVFMSDSATAGRPDVVVWNGVAWKAARGGTSVTLRQFAPSIADLLGVHRLFLSRGLPASTDQDTAQEVALHALPPMCCHQDIRVAAVDTGNVIDTDTGTPVCLCWVFEILRTTLPTCPGLEVVQREAIVLVDVQTDRLIRAIDDPAPPGVSLGSCSG